MSSPGEDEPTRSHSSSKRIDQACDQFEAAWRAGVRPKIEESLDQVSEHDRPLLLRELLEIELQMRQRGGEPLELEEYRRRFPADAPLVETVFPRVVKCTRLGDYELLEELGRGGMGVVYRARQPFLDKCFAIKVLPERYLDEPQAIARFRREMQAIAAVDHPNIVRAYNAGEAGGTHFLVMEYVEGINFHRLVVNHGRLGIRAACEAIRQAAAGLQHAHEHGLVHRDIKPANLMLARSGVVKILDLGLAKLVDPGSDEHDAGQLTKSGTTIGTIDYMSPEQWESSAAVDIRADVYSLGCTLFFLLIGRPPYSDESYGSSRKRLMAHVIAPVPSLLDHREGCPVELDEILARMMAKEPVERFQTPGEVAEAIDAFADVEELQAYASDTVTIDRGRARSKSAVRTAEADTANKPGSPSPRRVRSPGWRAQPVAWYRRTSTLLAAAVVGMALVTACLVVIRRPEKPPVVPPTPPAAAPAAPAGAQQLSAEVCTLPSLEGGWWFNEMPWLVPFVRKTLAEQFTDPRTAAGMLESASPAASGLSNPNTVQVGKALHDWAAGLCETRAGAGPLRPDQVALTRTLMSAAEANLTDEKLAEQWRSSMDAFSRGDGDGPRAAEDLHTLAVLQHSLAMLGNDAEMTRTAKATYAKALEAYEKAGSAPLERLCRADCARLFGERPGSGPAVKASSEEVKRLCERALAGLKDDQLPLFRADTLLTQANAASLAAANSNEYGDADHAFRSAEDILKAAGFKGSNHPLLAYVWESYAWCKMDQWLIDDAKDLFTRAADNRRQNLENRENRTALIHALHDRHGIAIVKRYRGQVMNAKADFMEVIEDTRQALRGDHAGRANQRYARDLRERLYNSSERYGDCFLYQGMASEPELGRFRMACELYQTAYDEAEDRAVKVSMGYKRAIALALMSKESAAAVEPEVKELDKCELGPEAERGGLFRQVAHAVIALQVVGLEAGQRKLREFLEQFYGDAVKVDWKKRETLELQLFCAELLLSSELKNPAPPTLTTDRAKYLDKLIREFPFAEERIAFLWRYVDLAIRAVGETRPWQGLRYVLLLHGASPPPSAALLAFHLHNDAGIGFFRAQEKVEAFPLPQVGRRQIRAMSLKGKPSPLDPKLVEAVTECLRAGQKVIVLWQENEERAPFGRALTNDDWPFAPPLAKLCSPNGASSGGAKKGPQ